MRNSWTKQFLKEWYPRLGLASAIRLRSRLIRIEKGRARPGRTFVLNMRRPFRGRVRLREWGSDLVTFEEIVIGEIYNSVASNLTQVQTIVDLGANIGLASLYFADRWPSCRILAIEPNPETYRILVSNLAGLARRGRGRTLQAAVWSAHTMLSPAQQPGRFSAFSVHEAGGERAEPTILGETMGEIIEQSGFATVDLLKVDAEGAETRLFAGDSGWLSRVGSIAIEFHGDSRKASNFDEITWAYGFRSSLEGDHTVLVSRTGKPAGTGSRGRKL